MNSPAIMKVQYSMERGAGKPREEIGLEIHCIGPLVSIHGGSETDNSACLMMPPNAARALAAALREMADQVDEYKKGRYL